MEKTRNCQNCKSEFKIDAQDFEFYERIKVPPPTFCWTCRAQRRMAFRNERILYKRKSDFSEKDIFSMYAPDSGYKVYEKEIWLSDQWDPITYGRDYDFSKPFFAQFKELMKTVPFKNLNVVNGVRSDYSNNFTDPKNCYLCFNGNSSEDCMYSHGLTQCQYCVDVSHLSKSEWCYDSFWVTSGSRNIGCVNCENSFDMWFSKNCFGCSNCFGCVGLKKKQYCIWNKQYTKEAYEAELRELNLGSRTQYEKMKTQAQTFWLQFPNKFIEGSHNTDVSGNYIDHSKDVKNSFIVREGEHLKFCQYVQELPGSKDCYDWSIWGDNGQWMYECHACGIGTSDVKFSLFTQENSRAVEYSMICSSSSNLFGCISLRKKEYCILNKQYSKEEYEALRAKIIAHMDAMPYTDTQGRVYKYGEFFPIELSPVGYNESMAQEYFPLSKEDAVTQGYAWRDTADRNYQPTIRPRELPDHIHDVKDSITNEIIMCAHAEGTSAGTCNQLCTSAFRIISDELDFYRKFGIPLPHLCHNCRTFERLKQRTGLQLYARQCECNGVKSRNDVYTNTAAHLHGSESCSNTFETAYGPDRKEIVYCENCYQQEVS